MFFLCARIHSRRWVRGYVWSCTQGVCNGKRKWEKRIAESMYIPLPCLTFLASNGEDVLFSVRLVSQTKMVNVLNSFFHLFFQSFKKFRKRTVGCSIAILFIAFLFVAMHCMLFCWPSLYSTFCSFFVSSSKQRQENRIGHEPMRDVSIHPFVVKRWNGHKNIERFNFKRDKLFSICFECCHEKTTELNNIRSGVPNHSTRNSSGWITERKKKKKKSTLVHYLLAPLESHSWLSRRGQSVPSTIQSLVPFAETTPPSLLQLCHLCHSTLFSSLSYFLSLSLSAFRKIRQCISVWLRAFAVSLSDFQNPFAQEQSRKKPIFSFFLSAMETYNAKYFAP